MGQLSGVDALWILYRSTFRWSSWAFLIWISALQYSNHFLWLVHSDLIIFFRPAKKSKKIYIGIHFWSEPAYRERNDRSTGRPGSVGKVGCTACALSRRTDGSTDIWWPSSHIGTVGCTSFVLSHRTGGPKDICWPSSPMGTVSRTAFVRTQKSGRPKDICWPSSHIGTVRCTTSVLCHRTGGPKDICWPSSPAGTVACIGFEVGYKRKRRKEEDPGKSSNLLSDGGENLKQNKVKPRTP